MKSFWTALGFLTVFPVPAQEKVGVDNLGRAAVWFSLIGAALGALVALLYLGLLRFFTSPVSATLSVAAWIYLTGGLHLDGLADSYDGLFNASPPQRRLEIMKDPRVGTFGVIGLILTILLKIVAMSALDASLALIAVPLAASLGRWLLNSAALKPAARPDGMGAIFQKGIKPIPAIVSAVIPLSLAILGSRRGIVALVLGSLAALGIFHWARRRLGGLTGDILGLMVETVEVVVLLVFAAQI